MVCFKLSLLKPSKTSATESESRPLVQSTEKSVRKIHRIPTKIRESAEDNRQRKDGDEISQQTTNESSKVISLLSEALSDHINQKGLKLEESHPRFGPFYCVDHSFLESTKVRAWDHVLEKTPEIDSTKTTETYLEAIRDVEEEAKKFYAGQVSGVESRFRWMMIKDGCFFLQLAFMILGRSEQLEYPEDDPFFVRKPIKKNVKKWIEAMFFVGNQIPLSVLKVLMKQEFFQGVVKKRKWDPILPGRCEKVLYEFLVSLENGRGSSNVSVQEPCDLIHFLHNQVIGPAPDPSIQPSGEQYDETDLEANEGDIDDDEINFPCATKLIEDGIRIKILKDGGVRRIAFKTCWPFCATLYLPAFPVDENAETIVKSLKTYEMSQESMGRHKRQVSAYLRLMSNIIQTTDDVKLLEKARIIEGDLKYSDRLPGIFKRLMSSKDIRFTDEFHILRLEIRNYSSPWNQYKGLISSVLIFTIIQVCISLADYISPRKP